MQCVHEGRCECKGKGVRVCREGRCECKVEGAGCACESGVL